jgi:hypothetical protein
MPFTDVLLADVELDKPQPVPLGTYVFSLAPGSLYRKNKFNGMEELNVRFVVSDGDLVGKGVFVSYPDPTATSSKGKSMAWSAQALKKLEIALGVDALPGEDSATYLNRVASNGAARVTADVIPDRFIKEGETEPRPVFGIFTVRAAA